MQPSLGNIVSLYTREDLLSGGMALSLQERLRAMVEDLALSVWVNALLPLIGHREMS